MNLFSPFPAMKNPLKPLWLALAAFVAPAILPASAQVVVYRMSFKPRSSFNLDFYDSGFFVAPATGGSGSFIFTIKDKGADVYTTSSDTGTVFPVVKTNGSTYWAVRADSTTVGGATSGYLAFGKMWRWTRFTTPTFNMRVKIAPEMRGSAVAAAQESATTTTGTGTTAVTTTKTTDIGFAAVFDWKLAWDEKLTTESNQKGLDVAGTVSELETWLQRVGFTAETTTTGGGGTNTGGGTGSTPQFGSAATETTGG